MAGTQPYSSPDLEAGDKKDPDLQPVTPEAGDELTQDTAGPRSTVAPGADSRRATGSGGGSSGSGGQKQAGEIGSDDSRTSEQKRIEDEHEDESSALDDTLDDSFPASDPPSHSTPSKGGQA